MVFLCYFFCVFFFFFFFFFQAEDGIRDADVTGVQTCALPIFFDRVPSGKITAERWFFCIYCPRLLIAGSACFGSFLSIKTEPPCFKLNETLGIPLPNSFLLTNFGCVSRKNQIILTISNID